MSLIIEDFCRAVRGCAHHSEGAGSVSAAFDPEGRHVPVSIYLFTYVTYIHTYIQSYRLAYMHAHTHTRTHAHTHTISSLPA
jgi:hypothetical protein